MNRRSRTILALATAALAMAVLVYGVGAVALSVGLKTPLYASTLRDVVLNRGSDVHAYLGDTTTITIGVYWGNISAQVKITTKSTAYDALAAILVGIWNDKKDSYTAFGANVNTKAKDGCGKLYWSCYSFTLLKRNHTAPKEVGSKVVASAYADYEVHHTVWWGFVHKDHADHLVVHLSATLENS